MKSVALLFVLSLACFADSVPYALQPTGSVSLSSNPMLSPTLSPGSGFGNVMVIGIPLNPINSDVTFTLTIGNFSQTFTIPVNLPTGGIELISFSAPLGIYHATGGTFSFSDGFNDGGTYGFSFADPVPEPGTWALMLTGIPGLLLMRRQFART